MIKTFVLSLLLFFSLSVLAEDLYRGRYEKNSNHNLQDAYNSTTSGAQSIPQNPQGVPPIPPGTPGAPLEDVKSPGGALNDFFMDGPRKLKEFVNSNRALWEQKTKSTQGYVKFAQSIWVIAMDPKLQQQATEIARKFKFKPLLLAEALWLILCLIYRSSRPGHRSIMIRVFEQFLISNVYIAVAILGIPTIFMGTTYFKFVFNLGQRILALYYPALGPTGQ